MKTRDQERAIDAYDHVQEVPEPSRDEYRTLVRGLGPLVMRSGLVTALAFLQRRKETEPSKLLFEHLAIAGIPGLQVERARAADQLCERARHLDLDETMLATRELLRVVEWLKRAVEATFTKED